MPHIILGARTQPKTHTEYKSDMDWMRSQNFIDPNNPATI